VQFALVWWLTTTTGSAVLVSLAAAMTVLPRALLNPLIGVVVDRVDRKVIMVGANLVVVLCSFFLASAFVLGAVQPWQILTVLLLHATADTFYARAFVSSTSTLVPSGRLTRVAGINQALMGIMLMAAPALGALLLEISSFVTVMGIDFLAALFAIAPLLLARIPRLLSHQPDDRSAQRGLLHDIRAGLRYIRRWSGAVGMLIISATMNFVMQPYFSLLAVYVASRGGDETTFGLFGAVVGFGFLAGGVLVGIVRTGERRMMTALFGIVVAGIALVATSLIDGLLASLCCFFIAGAAMPFCMGPIQALVQSSVPSGLQGRLFSIMECVSTAVAPVGLLLAGAVFEHLGPALWYLVGGSGAILCALFGVLRRDVRNLGPAHRSAGEPTDGTIAADTFA
jgi:DHA3 family macrolide efflux protein-like MFS transporter